MFKYLILIVLCAVGISRANEDYNWQFLTTITKPDVAPRSDTEILNRLYYQGFVVRQQEAIEDLVTVARPSLLLEYHRKFISYDSLIYINRELSVLGVYQRGSLTFWASVTRGRRISFTPAGEFRVKSKTRLMYSKKYGNVPMPFALHVIGNICIHQGPMPGRPASHGCVRLFKSDAVWLYNYARIGTQVIIE